MNTKPLSERSRNGSRLRGRLLEVEVAYGRCVRTAYDTPVGVPAGGVLHYIEADHLGTPLLVYDPMRNVPVWAWDIKGEAFGDSIPNQDPDADGQAFVFDVSFPGQPCDAASGLNYNYFRDYDSSAGRYVQSDPIGLEGGISTYGDVGGLEDDGP